MGFPSVQSVGIVVFDGAKVLLVRHGATASHYEGIIGLPAGKIDPGESAVQTAARELREETGLITTIIDLTPLPDKYQATIEQKKGTYIFDWYVFLCRKYSGEIKTTSETIPFWHEVDKLSELELLPNVREAILTAQKMLHL